MAGISRLLRQVLFAKPPELDADIFPQSEGLIVADGHDGAILRDSPNTPLAPARRKALTLKLARLGADRIHALMDPGPK
ncbi:MmcB family DNA repair protein [Devosia sp. J2-20]|uniref:MmcB family DNA repair protein n=1 Tax=Devosia sp. J2-20 TaxID=3026161 RepID=UPI0032B707FC